MNELEQIEGRLLEQSAKEADRRTTPARDMAARLIAHANAVKARRPVPEYARTPNGAAIERGFGLKPFQWESGSK